MHFIQQDILKKLLFSDHLRYSQLKPAGMEGSQFTFHMDQLVAAGLVHKTDSGGYALTEKGKGMSNRIDFDSPQPNLQAKQSVVFCATRNNVSEVLLYTRLKNPFFEHQGFPTGKVQYGELIIDTAKRELREETGLEGNPYLVAIRHYRVFFPDKHTLVEDKVMYIHRIDDPTGALTNNNEGNFFWTTVKDIKSQGKYLPEFKEVIGLVLNFDSNISFQEVEHYPAQF